MTAPNTQGPGLSAELLDIARSIEGLKLECGMDPESPRAIQNGRYMSIAYRLRALAACVPEPSRAEQASEPFARMTAFAWADHQSEVTKKLTRETQPMHGFVIPLFLAASPSQAPKTTEQPQPVDGTVWAHLAHVHKLLSRMDGSDAQEVRHSLYSVAETLRVWNQRIIDVGVIAMRSTPTAASASAPAEPTKAVSDVLAERHRQINAERWTAEHDDEHTDGSLSVAAACYALVDVNRMRPGALSPLFLWKFTGWDDSWWKPKDRRSNLVRASALILAELERIDRAALSTTPKDAK